ncbi:MAG: hypothetical protein WC421_03760 [Elusimicrobiales bacterium]
MKTFAEFDWLLGRFLPRTPYGRAAKDRLLFYSSPKELEGEFGLTEAFISFAAKFPVRADKLEFHLARIPFIDENAPPDCAALFCLKKFLLNAKAAFALLPKPLAAALGADWRLEGLLKTLSRGEGGENFHIDDSFSPELVSVRREIAAVSAEIARLRGRTLARLKREHSLDFSAREFIVIEESSAAKLFGNPDFFIEPHDSSHVVVRPVFGAQYLELCAKRDGFARAEKREEAKILSALARGAARHLPEMRRCAAAVERADILLAKARLAAAHGLTRPVILKPGAAIVIKKGRLPPLEARLAAEKLRYSPLSCGFSGRVAVISGSNMGGKTVALKTLGFCQLCLQHGFFVPAEKYSAPVFAAAHFAGGGGGEVAGLSSFGLELHGFMSAWKDADRGCFILMDEFARATNSREGGALLSAIISAFCAKQGVYAFVSTHFSGLRAPAAYYRMKGFDGAAFSGHGGAAGDLRGRLRQINRFMRYELAPDSGKAANCDALEVARLLGFDGGIISRAKFVLEGK